MRDQLTAEIKDLNSADEAASWAHRVLDAKNSLAAADAEHVEHAFQFKIATFDAQIAAQPKDRLSKRSKKPCRSTAINKSVLAFPAARRIRDREHVKSVAKQACLICGRRPADAHHLRFTQPPALGRKVSDEFTVPLCRGHHREVHRCGDETVWWNRAGIDPTVAARALWLKTHPLPPTQQFNLEARDSALATNSRQSETTRDQPGARGAPNYKTKPISESSSL